MLASLSAVPGGGIAVDATGVYFTIGCSSSVGGMTCGGSSVMKVPKAGGAAVTLAPGVGALAIATDGTTVYWDDTFIDHGAGGPGSPCAPGQTCVPNTSGNDVRSVPAAGGPYTILATDQGARIGLAVQSGNLYWTNQVCPGGSPSACMGALTTLGGANVTPVPLVTAAGHTFGALAVDPDGVNYIDDGAMMRIPLTGGLPTRLAPAPADSVASDGANVYYTIHSCPGSAMCAGAVMKVSLSGGSPMALATLPPGGTTPSTGVPAGLAVDAENVYWTGFGCGDAGCEATVNRVSRDGGPVTTLALNRISAGSGAGLALDDTNVYWLDFACPTGEFMLCVMTMPK